MRGLRPLPIKENRNVHVSFRQSAQLKLCQVVVSSGGKPDEADGSDSAAESLQHALGATRSVLVGSGSSPDILLDILFSRCG